MAAKDKSADELKAALIGQANPKHDFSANFTAPELDVLVLFLQKGVIDKGPYITDGKGTGDPTHGKTLFNAICKVCHGVDGNTINFQADEGGEEFIGNVANDNPMEFFNKASVGQPGEAMPAGLNLGWSLQDVADVLAYAQTLPQK